MRATTIALAAILSGLAVGGAAAAPAVGDDCFLSRDYQAFKAVDAHSFYVRANLHDIYRVEVEGTCPLLTEPDARLITVEHGQTRSCGPLDWQLRVAEPGGPSMGCIVKAQHRLAPAEAAAIPPFERP